MPSIFQHLLAEGKTITVFPLHNDLNPKLWNGITMIPSVLKALKRIALEFEEFLGSPNITVTDVIFTGSLANYNYTKYSDIDLHLIVDVNSDDSDSCVVDLAEFFMAKKNLWNHTHDITIRGFPVELYVQLADEELVSTGIYSITSEQWATKPKTVTAKYDKYAVHIKAKHFADLIDKAVRDKVDDAEYLRRLNERIRSMRKSGLETAGEFAVENLAFKSLRNTGHLAKLADYRSKLKDTELSM